MKRRKRVRCLCVVMMLVGAFSVKGDVLELKDGSILKGNYVGGTAGAIRFETSTGIQVIETSKIIALTFTSTGGEGASSLSEASPSASVLVAPSKTITLPAGTLLLVRIMDNVSSKNKAGTTFSAKLEYDLFVGDTLAVKGGTTIYGKVKSSTQARRAIGRSTLDIRLTELAIDGKPMSISTGGYQAAGEASIAKAARGAAAGAIIGGIADGSDGAKKGAAIGATAGALKKGQTLTVSSGSLLEFNLAIPVTLTVNH